MTYPNIFTEEKGAAFMRLPDEDFGEWAQRNKIVTYSSLGIGAYLFTALGELDKLRAQFEEGKKEGEKG